MIKSSTILLFSAVLMSCSSGGEHTLGDLAYNSEKEKPIEFKTLGYKEVREEYQELLLLFNDDDFKEQIERRIADVYMLESGKKQLQAKPSKSYYVEAIKNYHKVLDKYPNSPDNADILYQLARAYDMDGQSDKALKVLLQLTAQYPNYESSAEAHFRMGDIYFSQQSYRKAQTEYTIVSLMQNEKLTKYSYYMLGWTNYKQFNYEGSVDSFATVLNLVFNKTNDMAKLSLTDKPLVDDSIESMSLALSKNGGAEVIEKIASLNDKPYLWKIYDSLGEYFLKKERYEDSADTFRRYVKRYNFSIKAPTLHSKLIATYIKGKFPVQALKEKEMYVEYYGVGSKYARVNGGPNEKIRQDLRVYYDELASHYHSAAQAYQRAYDTLIKSKKKDSKKRNKLSSDIVSSYERASHFYDRYVFTFPKDKRVPEMLFLKAEANFSIKKYPLAISDFELVAYQSNDFKLNKYRSKAGYAAIISYQKYIAQLKAENRDIKKWQAKAVDSMLRFSEIFHDDERSPKVLTNAAEYLFGLNQYQRALEVAEKLISSNKKLDYQLKKTAYGIAAHSYFQLSEYRAAEKNYISQRALTVKGSKEYEKISERIATSLYKHSEFLVESKDEKSAIESLLRIKTITPDSKVRVDAQYNAATLLLATKQWSRAIIELKQLIEQYPNYKSALEFPRKLALAYEKNKSWLQAGDAYLMLSKNDSDAQVRQDALYIAAGMYEKNKNYNTALELFKRYARSYEKPFVVRMEARYRIAELYGVTNDKSRQLFWFRRIIQGDKKAGTLSNQRSRWLAAWANAKYGDYYASEFKRHKLTSLKANKLNKKNSALKDAAKRYEMASNYGILEFVTMASVKTAALYLDFSDELRRIPMPAGLLDEEKKLFVNIINEQAEPFESLSMELHIGNIERAWQGEYDDWIRQSFTIMRRLSPVRFNKVELEVSYGDEIR